MRKTAQGKASAAILASLPLLLAAASLAQDSAPQEQAPPPAQAGSQASQPAADQTQPLSQPQPSDPPALVARIGHTLGNVSFMASGSSDWSAGVDNYPMISGDRLFCDKDAQAEIATGTTSVRLWQSTDITLTNLGNQLEQIGLATGSIRVRIYSVKPGATIEVDTPNGAATISQPGDYRFHAFAGDENGSDHSDALVNSGVVQITGPNGLNQQVTAGQAVQMTGVTPIQITSISLPAFDALDQWSIDRDHDVLNSQSAQYVNPETPGASDLDANGAWTPTPDYGPVWTPTTVSADWSPYSVGYWAYVSPWGYTWVDAAPWGYTPFHYGRWVVYSGRWGWVPGPRPIAPVYSPALVAWVGGPHVAIGVGVAAWFPLGVGEPYLPWYHASPYYARQVNVTNVNVAYIHNTTMVNNYNNFIANTRTVNSVSQISTSNLQYANRAHFTAVPETAMTSGRPVVHSTVGLTPAAQQQLAIAPVHYAPTAPAPQQPLLAARTNVHAPAAHPMLVTTHGLAPATPAANPAHPQTTEARIAANPTRPEYLPQPYNSTIYNHTQQSASKPKPQPKQKPQKAPKPPKEEKPKR